ncbi:hypothetical protein ACBJ59_61340 [Nonomuraea sp. MTCD27]|uniref:hypothetical protein n=1 Tax=Nonomuraea sp. MTCD27 TaxID=1676747 RepID=UPI0035C0CC0E
MKLARAYQIPRSKLLGREPREVTVFEYDDADRLVRAITVREPEWLEEDRDWALADLDDQASRCPNGCGMPLEDTTHPDNEGAYVADEPPRCHACAAVTAKKKAVGDPTDLIFTVRKVR